MLQQESPDDYVVATGETNPVREFCRLAFERVNLDYQDYVKIDERFYRPAETELLVGDSSKAREHLGWKPTTNLSDLIHEMVDADVERIRRRSELRSS